MAENGLKTIQENLVEELLKKGDEIPPQYILNNGYPEAIDAPSELWSDTLLIDFSLLSSPSSADAELAKLRSALFEWRCFQVINHGIETSFLDELILVIKQFLAFPVEEKLKCSDANDVRAGYSSDSDVGLWNDRLLLCVKPDEKRKLFLWPQKPEKFRSMIEEYSTKIETVKEMIYKAMAKSLNLDEECFLNHQGRSGPQTMRFNFYPRCPCPDRVLGGKPHTDAGTLTIVLADNIIEGLQIQKDDTWYKVSVIPGALFVNLGDTGEAMTNGIYKSLVHRVVANEANERVSVAGFCDSEEKNEIGPVSELISDEFPQQYKRFSSVEYKKVFFETIAQGRNPRDALKL